ncbi:MAG: RNA polymerase sigma factor [Saprospiraceae bacterium]
MAWLRSKREDKRSDESLAKEYRDSKDQAVLGVLYARYLELMYGLCLQYFKDAARAEDATIDIYEELRVKLLKHQVDNFRPWMYRLARNHCLMVLRRGASHMTMTSSSVATHQELDPADMQLADNLHLEGEAKEKEALLVALEACTDTLPANQSDCIRRFYLNGESYADIAATLAFSIGKVRSAIQNGRRNLKICLEGKQTHA